MRPPVSKSSFSMPHHAVVVTEFDLQAWLDGELAPGREALVRNYLETHPDQLQRLESYRSQKRALHALFDPVLDEPMPQHLLQAAWPRTPWAGWRLVAGATGVVIALASGAAGWGARGWVAASGSDVHPKAGAAVAAEAPAALSFVQRAAVAHAVYSPDQRRPVEVDAAHEAQLVTWLTKRLGAPVRAPHLQALGFELEGGRLLPGGDGPVAQFMYRQAEGERLTLYLSNEQADLESRAAGRPSSAAAGPSGQSGAAFRFARLGPVNVFYWVDAGFGYALSGDVDRARLADVADEVYRQLASNLPACAASAAGGQSGCR